MSSPAQRLATLQQQAEESRAVVTRVVEEACARRWATLKSPEQLEEFRKAYRERGARGLVESTGEFFLALDSIVTGQMSLVEGGEADFKQHYLKEFRHVFWDIGHVTGKNAGFSYAERELRPLMRVLGLPVHLEGYEGGGIWQDFRAARAQRKLAALLTAPILGPQQLAQWQAMVGSIAHLVTAFKHRVDKCSPWPDVVASRNWDTYQLVEDAGLPLVTRVHEELRLRDRCDQSSKASARRHARVDEDLRTSEVEFSRAGARRPRIGR